MMTDGQIGWLIDGHRVVGVCCQPHVTRYTFRVPIFRVNIGAYKQTCHHCGKLLVAPATRAWPELFSARKRK